MENFEYTVIYEPAEDGGFIAHVPALNGLTTEGDSIREIKEMVYDAIKGYIETLKKKNLPIPLEKFQQKPFIEKLAISV